jgi:hypothetical protein
VPPAILFSFAATVLVVLVAFRGGRASFAVLAALVVGIGWMGGMLVLLRVKLQFLNFIALPITFGIGVDYAVNIVARYVREGAGLKPPGKHCYRSEQDHACHHCHRSGAVGVLGLGQQQVPGGVDHCRRQRQHECGHRHAAASYRGSVAACPAAAAAIAAPSARWTTCVRRPYELKRMFPILA